ncbi:MAG TPA: DinB family protein [Gemmatimonadota bacterium]|nr:DinB family protein [Gemmatimonadota bacterium]
MFADLLEEALDAWTDARRGVIAELENIPAERYDFRPAEEVRSVAELACHIMEVSELMVGELTSPDTDFHRAPFPELVREHAAGVQGLTDRDGILEAMERTLERGRDRFREAGELHMLQLIERFDGERGTRMAWMHHGIAQEMYHRGQLCTYARLLGLVPALTKRIRGQD